jgi:hypothetical protein
MTRARLLEELAPLTSLADVVRWSFAAKPPREIVEVVAQDEYTNDVVMAGADDLYLVFDTT